MPIRKADATWNGDLKDGHGEMSLSSGAWKGPYSFGTRFENAKGSNPEELIGAAHAGCFSMALAAGLGKAGHKPQKIHTEAKVHIDKAGDGFAITKIELKSRASVPDIDPKEFAQIADATKEGCPVSKALAAVDIELDAALE